MTSDVVLTAALRNNLLSLQNTQSQIDTTQLQLSTGKKVNSALDNPQSFFASQSLSNRASDLNNLLDGIGQSIEVIKAADNGVTALTDLINQAQAVAQSAQTAVAGAASGTAKIVGNVDLSKLSTIVGAGGIAAGDGITVTTYNSTGASITSHTVSVAAGDTAAEFANKITTAFAADAGVVVGSLDASGQLNIETTTAGDTMRIDGLTFAGGTTLAKQSAGLAALGLSNSFGVEDLAGSTNQQYAATVSNGNALVSHALTVTAGGAVATENTLLSALTGTAAFTVNTSDDILQIKAGGQTLNFSANGATVGDLVNQINGGPLSGIINASFNSADGTITLAAANTSVGQIQIGNESSAAGGAVFAFGFGANKSGANASDSLSENIDLGGNLGSSSQLTSLQTQYDDIRTQIDALVQNGDTGYQGTNLLNGDDLLTTFNENRTSTLTTQGQTFDSAGLGISAANFSTTTSVNTALTQTDTALNTVRDFGTGLATDLAVIQTRQTFTNSLISTLQEGAGELVNADQNEAGATLLALQTRQSLGVTALSLASQSNQSILRLFQ